MPTLTHQTPDAEAACRRAQHPMPMPRDTIHVGADAVSLSVSIIEGRYSRDLWI